MVKRFIFHEYDIKVLVIYVAGIAGYIEMVLYRLKRSAFYWSENTNHFSERNIEMIL